MIALGQTLDLSLFSPSMFFRDNLLKFPDLNEGEDENGEDKNDSLIDDDEPSDAEIYEANTSEMKKKKKKNESEKFKLATEETRVINDAASKLDDDHFGALKCIKQI